MRVLCITIYPTSFCRSVKSELMSSGVITLFLFFFVGPFRGWTGFLLEGGSLNPVPPMKGRGEEGVKGEGEGLGLREGEEVKGRGEG